MLRSAQHGLKISGGFNRSLFVSFDRLRTDSELSGNSASVFLYGVTVAAA
jgi:hypothetical protein